MTTIELPSVPLVRPSRLDALLLDLSSAASSLVERRMARRSARVAARPTSTEVERAARAGAHALGLLPR